jgi:methionine synthase II (cobalamin-independent)
MFSSYVDGLTRLFAEIRRKNKLADLDIQYRKFAEWLRIEVAAAIYHIFLAEDNSSELFAQGKRIHSLIPYTLLKNIIRIANPATVITGVLDLFLATPFKSRSLMQRVLGMAINDGIKHLQKSVDSLFVKIDDPVLCEKLKAFTKADEEVKDEIRLQAKQDQNDLVVTILRSSYLGDELDPSQIEKVFNGYVSFVGAIDNVSIETFRRVAKTDIWGG